MTPLDELLVKLRAYRSVNEWGDPVRHEILDQAADALEAAARENERLREALVNLQDHAEQTEATFRERLGERDRPTWFAVNALQDFVGFVRMWTVCHEARNALSGGPQNG